MGRKEGRKAGEWLRDGVEKERKVERKKGGKRERTESG